MASNNTNELCYGRVAIVGNHVKSEVQVAVGFDWRPTVIDGRVQFHLSLARGTKRSDVTLEIDLNQLTEHELERLLQFLIQRQLDATTHEEMAAAICWLINLALRQSDPDLSLAERTSRLRQLLFLQTPHFQKTP